MNDPRGDAEGDSPLEAPAARSRSFGKETAPLSTPPKKFDAYHRWLGIPPAEQPPDHYRLLGVPRFEADPDVIQSAADQRMAHLRTFQSGPHGRLSQKLLNEVAAAKVCLLQPDKKAAYDRRLRGELWARCSSRLVDDAGRGRPSEVGEVGGEVGRPAPGAVEKPAAAGGRQPTVLAPARPIPVAPSPGTRRGSRTSGTCCCARRWIWPPRWATPR